MKGPADDPVRRTGPIEVPKDVFELVEQICLNLPEVTVRVDESRTETRSTAYSYDVRRRSFCLLVATAGPSGDSDSILVLRADQSERDAMLSHGHPYFAPRSVRDRLGVHLDQHTDWVEIRELVTESYRLLAPKKLIQLLG